MPPRLFPLSLVVVASLAIPALAACTRHSPAAEADAAASSPITPEISPVDAVATLPAPTADPLAWRWIRFADDGPFSEVGPKQLVAGDHSCRFEHDDDRPGALARVCCEGPGAWCQDLREDFVPGVSLASDGERLFVADYPAISSGAQIHAFALTDGQLLWSRQALAIGPQAHSEYFNVVQLRLVDGQLIAYGDESHGGYIETMDPRSGSLLDHRLRTPPRPTSRWDEAAPEPTATVEIDLDDGGSCRFVHDENADQRRSSLSCTPGGDDAEDQPWQREVEAHFIGRGALAATDDRLLLVTWSRIANGAQAAAYDLHTGAELWATPLEGIGVQEHSKYSNLIQIAVEADSLLIEGHESHGHYQEARALADGALRWSLISPGL